MELAEIIRIALGVLAALLVHDLLARLIYGDDED